MLVVASDGMVSRRLALSKQDLAQTLSNEPRYWATAGALVDAEAAIAATAEHVESLAATDVLRQTQHSRHSLPACRAICW